MEDELIDEVDREGNVIATHKKSHLKERMFMHKVSLIIPVTHNNKILLTRRAKDKHPYPDMWVCAVGGKAMSGESEKDAATREMREEIGKSYPLRKVASFVYDENDYKAIFTIFTTTVPVDPKELTLDPNEIQYSRAFDIEEARRMAIESPGEFAPTFVNAIAEFAKNY